MTKQTITEEMKVHEKWYDEADEVRTLDDLVAFMKRLGEEYEHDYGTIVHASGACLLATGKAFNRSYAGLSGFQAFCVMWVFIKRWMHLDGPLRLVEYKNMLYPKYHDKFQKTIDRETWDWLQKQARESLANKNEHTHQNVIAHWRSIVDGRVPFGYAVKE